MDKISKKRIINALVQEHRVTWPAAERNKRTEALREYLLSRVDEDINFREAAAEFVAPKKVVKKKKKKVAKKKVAKKVKRKIAKKPAKKVAKKVIKKKAKKKAKRRTRR